MCIFHSNGSNDVFKHLVSRLVMGSSKDKEQYLETVRHKLSHLGDLDGSNDDNISKSSALFISMILSWFNCLADHSLVEESVNFLRK